jgi:serine/threonine-protein kinase HipA
MDVMGEALDIERQHMMALGEQEAELTLAEIDEKIEAFSTVGDAFADTARSLYPDQITEETLSQIQRQIRDNISRLKKPL